MARHVKLKPIKLENGYWQLSIPANLSDTGKRKRQNFPTKKAADAEAERLKTQKELHGVAAASIPAQLAEDAAKAIRLLRAEGLDITLTAIAQAHIESHKRHKASKSIKEVFAAFMADEERTAGLSEKTVENYQKAHALFLSHVNPGKLIIDLTAEEIKAAVRKATESPEKDGNPPKFNPTFYDSTLAYLSPAFSYAMKEPRTWLHENPFTHIEKISAKKKATKLTRAERLERLASGNYRATVDYLSIDEVNATFAACADHRKNKEIGKNYRVDCSDCAPIFALMIFAGLRPDVTDGEILFIRWEDIVFHSQKIIVPEFAAKDGRRRVIEMSDNLKAWLELVPEDQRKGLVVPSNWKRKYQAVRKIAFIKDTGQKRQDVTRHTYATMQRAKGIGYTELSDLMGNSESVCKKHYDANIIDKEQAAAFWSIRPGSTAAQLKAVS